MIDDNGLSDLDEDYLPEDWISDQDEEDYEEDDPQIGALIRQDNEEDLAERDRLEGNNASDDY